MKGLGFWWVVPLLGLTAWARTAAAQPARGPAIWYRASEKCPTGADFLNKLADGKLQARLAGAGDHIDFVVTLGASGEETLGRLERQTNGGTVAIRELRDATCDRVADALALSLALALDPTQPAAADPTPASEPAALPVAAASEISPPPAAQPSEPSAPAPRAPAPRVTVGSSEHKAPPPTRFVGVHAGALTGFAEQPLLHGQVFVDIERVLPRVAPEVAVRLGVVGSLGSMDTQLGSIQRWITGARGELCPVRWGGARFGVRPCLAFELGVMSASREGGLSDQTLWAAPGAELRAGFAVLPGVRLELAAGALLPLRRGELTVGSESLYVDAIIALRAMAGVSFGLP